MKIAIIYRTMTGHSKKLAKAIAEELGAELFDIKKNPKLEKIDLLFVVGGIYSGKSLPNMLDYSKTINQGIVKKAVLITSSASKKRSQDEVRLILTNNGINVIDEYHCYGNFLFIKLGHPNKNEILKVKEFAKSIRTNLMQTRKA